MVHSSVKLSAPIELLNVTPVNPLISKCQIKVCYVGEQPNRNRSVITKEVATEMAKSLPGSPIVGFFNKENGDFEGHNRELVIEDEQCYFKDTTKPYGFVDLTAPVWFEKYLDDGVEHEYLCTEGYLWTGQYPEASRVLTRGNNQSMELDDSLTHGDWSINDNGELDFFIINEAIISKLCILGEDVEPCFEGASVTKVQYSFDDKFKNELFSLVEQMKKILQEGGTSVENNLKDEVLEETKVEEEVKPSEEFEAEEIPAEESVAEEVIEEEAVSEEAPEEEVKEEEAPEAIEEEVKDEEEAVKAYNLEEVVEYAELTAKYSALEAETESLKASLDSANAELAELKEFKYNVERKEKEAMINSFYMLSDEDKKDVVENIDSYSLDEIEAKLSVICVRNKVSFDLEGNKDNATESAATTYSLDDSAEDLSTPAWVKAVRSVAKKQQ